MKRTLFEIIRSAIAFAAFALILLSPLSVNAAPLAASLTARTNLLAVSFTGSASGGLSPYKYAWKFGDGGTASARTPSHAYLTAGHYTVTLTITDSASRTASASQAVVVTAPFDFALANKGNVIISQGTSATTAITARLISGASRPISFSAMRLPTGANASFSPASCSSPCSTTLTIMAGLSVTPGAYTITASGVGGGVTRATSLTLTTVKRLSASATVAPTSGSAPLGVSFTGSASGGASPYAYSWNFGNGTTGSTLQNPSHTYSVAGSYAATLTVTDSASHTATAASAISVNAAIACSGGVSVAPTDNLQTLVNNNPSTTTFCLHTGIHRDSVTKLKNGDMFIGQSGAIEDGAKVLSGWSQVRIGGTNYWTTAGGAPLSPKADPQNQDCLPGFEACNDPQDLFYNNAPYTHVTSLAAVAAGSWYYDFKGRDRGVVNNVYLSDNPNGQTVELGKYNYAFSSTASNITIQGLLVEKYASPLQEGAVEPKGTNWLIQNNEVTLNHGHGIQADPGGDNTRVLHNSIHDNGQMGTGSAVVNGGLWSYNQIFHNDYFDHVDPGWEGGGTKWAGNNVIISYNTVYDNNGTGLWTDSGGTNDTYDHNVSYDNTRGGIRYEISRDGVITNNLVYGNGTGEGTYYQIAYIGSDGGVISGNTIYSDSKNSAIFVQNILGTRGGNPVYKVHKMQATNNTIIITSTNNNMGAELTDASNPPDNSIFTDQTILFDSNTYYVAKTPWSSKSWNWAGRSVDRTTWQTEGKGQDVHGSVKACSQGPAGICNVP